MVPARQAVTTQPACPHAPDGNGDCAQPRRPGCSVGCRGPEPRNEPFRTRLWVPGGSEPPQEAALCTLSPCLYTPPPTIPHPRALSTFPSSHHPLQDKFSKPPSPLLLPYSSYRKPQHNRLPFHTHFLLLPCRLSTLWGRAPGLHSFHISHSTAVSLRAE